MRVSYRLDLDRDTSQKALLKRMESVGTIQIRGTAGEHSAQSGGIVDVSFRNRVGVSEARMLQDMNSLLAKT